MKKILFLGTFLAVLLINGTASAYEGGLLDGKPLYVGSGWTVLDTTLALTDRDPNTNIMLDFSRGQKNKVWYEFDEEVSINCIFIIPETFRSPKVIFYDSERREIAQYNYLGAGLNPIEVINNVRYVAILNDSQNYISISEFDVFEERDTEPPGEVTGLTAEAGDGEVTLRYVFPSDADFSHVKIYQDGNLIAERVTTTSYVIRGLTNGTKYSFKVTTVDKSGNESAGVTVSATPEEVSREVQNVRVTAKHDRVNLSWTNPKRNDFHHVKIYRKTLQNQALKIIPVAHAAEAEGYDSLFETNGTYFNDLTVQPETSYEYKLTTEDKNGVESTGVTVQVTTPPIPPPSTGGTTIIRHENGDVTVRWSPQPGQMIIEIDGVEYRRVDAQLGEYTIPAADIPVDENGKPAPIRLIPIAPNGDIGTPIVINPGGWLIALPFGAKELLEAGIDLLAVFGPIILLVLVLWYVRPIMRLLRQSARGRART